MTKAKLGWPKSGSLAFKRRPSGSLEFFEKCLNMKKDAATIDTYSTCRLNHKAYIRPPVSCGSKHAFLLFFCPTWLFQHFRLPTPSLSECVPNVSLIQLQFLDRNLVKTFTLLVVFTTFFRTFPTSEFQLSVLL